MSSVSRRSTAPAGVRGRRLDMAPIVSLVGLVVAAVLSFGLLNGQLPLPGSGSAGPGGVTGPRRTPNPSVIFTPPPEVRVEVRGTILFVQRGSIWAASGAEIARLSSRAIDSVPTWSPDGETIYYVETREQEARAPVIETDRDGRFILRYPAIMSMDAAGSDRREVASGLVSLGGRNRAYFSWLRQPDVNPEGDTIALVSDAPEPLRQDVVLSLLPAEGGDVRNLGVPAESPFGHADPDWSPRGDRIAYTHFDREGALGTSRIALYDVRENASGGLTDPGFARPAWSPDGRFLAVEEIDGTGRDIVIIRVSDGRVVSRLTRDGSGVAPSWSPDGRQIAYLKVAGQNIDLHVLTLSDDGRLAVAGDDAITTDSVLDAASRPAWFMPPELISAPSRSPAASPSE